MKKILFSFLFLSFVLVSFTSVVEAKSSYYKSAKTGKFVTKKSYYKSPSTTYRSYRK